MRESDELEEIREEKLESLKERVGTDGALAGRPESDPDGDETEPVEVSGPDHLRELFEGHSIVLVDFHADWCGPCKMLEPAVASVAAETPATVAKVDVDAQGQLAQQYGVRGVPTLVLVVDGDVAERLSGVRGKDELVGLIERYV